MLCSGDAQHVPGDGPVGVEGGMRHAPEYSIRFLFLFLLLSATIGLQFFYKISSFVIIRGILSRFFFKKVLVCSLQNTNSGWYLFSLFFWCCFAAAEPVLPDNKALRNKCIVPMVSFMSLPCCLFLQLATGSLTRSLILYFDNAE